MGERREVAIACGGTFGHLRGAIHLQKNLAHSFLIGVGLDRSPFIDPSIPFHSLKGKRNLSLVVSTAAAWDLLRKKKVKLVAGFGGYHAFPVLAAALLLRLPIRLFEPNVIPGKVTRWFAPFAEKIFLLHEEANQFLKKSGQVIEPVIDTEEEIDPYHYFSLEKNQPILLVIGGSLGARLINRSVMEGIAELPFQVIHLTGQKDFHQEWKTSYEKAGIRAFVAPFISRVDLAMKIADVAISRAGAMTLAELAFFSVPTVVIPLESSSEGHQRKNAEAFLKRNRAVMLLEREISCWKEAVVALLGTKEKREKLEKRASWKDFIL